MDYNEWLSMLRSVFGQQVVTHFRPTKSGQTLNCKLKQPFVIKVTSQSGNQIVVLEGGGHQERSFRGPWVELIVEIDRRYNQ